MKRSIIAIMLGITFGFPGSAWCQTSSGAKNGTVFANDNSVGVIAFSSPSNASLSDGSVSSASATVSVFNASTQYLKATGFGFSIPGSSSITGIKVEVEKSAAGINIFTSIKDNSVRLVKAGTIVGSDYAKTSSWSSSSSYSTYGANNDLWGTTWTRNDINASNFGVVFSADINGLAAVFPSAQIDHIRMTVYFNVILPISIKQFTAEAGADHSANIEWAYAGEDNSGQLNIQRRSLNHDWQTIKTYKAAEVPKEQPIIYTDANCDDQQAYYRMEVISGDGTPTYSNIVNVNWSPRKFSLYPNPSSNDIYINQPVYSSVVYCNGTNGSPWKLPVLNRGSEKTQLDIRQLPPGTYVLTVDGMRGMFIKK